MLVSGYAGIGKSSLVNELHKALVPPRGLFASGKFDQYKRDIPYATLAQAFRSLVRPLLSESEAELARWRDSLSEALGPNGELIVNLVPELELVIGKQPPVADLPPQDAKNRFQMVFRRFLSVFAREEHPLALFLDDLQWLDAATLDLLEHLVTHPEVRHLLLVGAYRDNEVDRAHPLVRTLEAIRDAGTRVEEIVLTPLGLDDIGRLVADAAHCELERARPLAQLVHEKTSGNPFFAIQFLTALNEDGLLAFDPVAPAWRWDIDRIRSKGYTDNVVDLMVEKLERLSAPAQEALKVLACLGNVADVATLTLVYKETEEAVHAALWESVSAGLVLRQESAYTFLHDRIQQAAYSLIPEDRRADVHLRIGRMLLSTMTPDDLAEHLFDIASQFNRGVGRLIDRDEKTQVATIDLRAGRRAKTSAAYASACVYLTAGMAVLDDSDWGSKYELIFSLWLERAECAFLTGDFDQAERLIAQLLQRGASKFDLAAVYRLKVLLHTVKSESPQALGSALTCLHLFGVDLPAHPTWEQVQLEYETIWQNLDGRPIQNLIDLPLMADPEMQAVTDMLSAMLPATYFTNLNLYYLLACRIVNVSMEYGVNGASANAYAFCGLNIVGSVFHRYRESFRFAKLAFDLVEKHGFLAYRAKVLLAMGMASFWLQPITTAIDFMRAAYRDAVETGDLIFVCFSVYQIVSGLFLRNDPLDAVWRESELALDFARQAKYGDVLDIIVSQQRFIANMQGRTATFSTFSDAQFDEAAFEAQMMVGRTSTMICWYWILKLKARFLSCDYAAALVAADKVRALLRASATSIHLLDYYCYAGLAVAAHYEKASADKQTGWRELLIVHREQLREWAENYPPTFADKYALVSAEIARLEGRDADAMRLYEEAIRSARENGFVQNEGTAHEVAAQFYAARGAESIAHSCLRNARYCYLRWGAHGKVKQLDERYPHLREETPAGSGAATIGAPVAQLDVETAIKASQAVSGEIVLENLIKTLMVIAVEHAGAERGVLILPRGDQLWVEAQVTTGLKTVEVDLRRALVAPSELPLSILQYVIRTQEPAIADDASREKPFSADEYVASRRVRSVLCLPLIKQAKLVGVLYLENNVAGSVFTPARIALLKLLASQAAISLENARLYGELTMSEERWRKLFESVPVGVGLIGSHRRYIATNPAFQRMLGYSGAELNRLSPADITYEDDRAETEAIVAASIAGEPSQRIEKRYRRQDGGVIWAEVNGFLASIEGSAPLLGAIAVDVTERKRAEEALRDAQAGLERMGRLTTMGELSASIAHEINQPLAAIVTQSEAAMRFLNRNEPDLDEVRDALSCIARDGMRMADVIRGLKALARKSGPQLAKLDIDDAIKEVLTLAGAELRRHDVILRTALATGDQRVMGDRIQLQQVLLNLIMNGVEAMREVTERTRELTVSSTLADPSSVLVAVQDTGAGLDPAVADRVFQPFFTTKPDGTGMGLAICRSIIETHGGRLWAAPRGPHGADIRFTIPLWADH